MSNTVILKIYQEILWWIFTLLVIFAVLSPIEAKVPGFPFYGTNVIFIVCFISFTRYIFLLRQSLFARLEWVKFLILASSAILIFILITSLGDFNSYIREIGLQDMVSYLPNEEQRSMVRYMHNEMIFFGVGAVVSAIALPFRLLISIWRGRNTGGV